MNKVNDTDVKEFILKWKLEPDVVTDLWELVEEIHQDALESGALIAQEEAWNDGHYEGYEEGFEDGCNESSAEH